MMPPPQKKIKKHLEGCDAAYASNTLEMSLEAGDTKSWKFAEAY